MAAGFLSRSANDGGAAAGRNAVAVVLAEAAGRFLGERVAVALAVRGAHERRDDVEVPLLHLGRLAPEVGQAQVDVEFEEVDSRWALCHAGKPRTAIGRHSAPATWLSVTAPCRGVDTPGRVPP